MQTEAGSGERTRHSTRGTDTSGRGWLVEGLQCTMLGEDVGSGCYTDSSEAMLNDTDGGW